MQRPENTNDPYCGNCGYILKGAVESSKCPECGKPLVEVLTRGPSFAGLGKRYRSKATLFGLPVIDVALGPAEGELRGKARGIIAIGDVATGWLAVGGMAFGIVAVGGVSVGLFALGGLAVGVITGLGGLAVAALASGGGAIGLLAMGGGAIGVFAQGGGALGLYTRGSPGTPGAASGRNATEAAFQHVNWFFGPWPPDAATMLRPMIVIVGLTVLAAGVIGLIAWWAIRREGRARSLQARSGSS
jgi:hypothetical protein